MFSVKRVRGLTWLLVAAAACVLSAQSLADERDSQEEFLKREYTLAKPYRGLGFSSSSYWDLMGNAMVMTDHVRLTPDLQSRQGAVWARHPFFLKDWELKVHFKIHGIGKKNLNGDGMAIWLTRERMKDGPVFGNMDHFVGLGVLVDTYPNFDKSHDRAFPYISVMLGNGTVAYDHDRDGRHSQLSGCSALVRNVPHDTFLLIRYSKSKLSVMVDAEGKQEWKPCVDIRRVRFPIGYYFGASAATGDLSDNHDIISMKLYQLTVEKTLEEEAEQEEHVALPRVDDMNQFQVIVEEEGMSGVQLLFTILISILGLGILAVVGFVIYGRWTEKRRKRFY